MLARAIARFLMTIELEKGFFLMTIFERLSANDAAVTALTARLDALAAPAQDPAIAQLTTDIAALSAKVDTLTAEVGTPPAA